ncbi:MAG: hypothetical protein RR531_13540 [Longicatena sp.]
MFDDGIMHICCATNIAEKGNVPKYMWELKAMSYFKFEKVGITRFYSALNADRKIDALIRIWRNEDVDTKDECILNALKVYEVVQVQHGKDEDGLDVTWLSLQIIKND